MSSFFRRAIAMNDWANNRANAINAHCLRVVSQDDEGHQWVVTFARDKTVLSREVPYGVLYGDRAAFERKLDELLNSDEAHA